MWLLKVHEWNPYTERRKSSSAKKMDVTNNTGHVTFFLVNLVVSVNGLSCFFAIETIPLLFLTPCKLDKVKIFAINRKQRDYRAEGLNLRCSQAPKRMCESFRLRKTSTTGV